MRRRSAGAALRLEVLIAALGIAVLAASALLGLFDVSSGSVMAWALCGSGVLWTLGLLYFDRQISRDPGRFGLIGKQATAAGPRSAALVVGLLTLLLALMLLRDHFGWPEITTIVLAVVAFVRWLVASIGLLRRRARRTRTGRRKPEHWRSLSSRRRTRSD